MATSSSDTYQVNTEMDTVEHLIMENNAAQFWLTEDTPPMQEPLLLHLRYLANATAAQQILDGTYVCPPEVDDVTWEFFLCLQWPPLVSATDRIDTSFSRKDFQAYWKKTWECTSSSISGLHFGHYKVATKNDRLSEMHAVSNNIAVNSGYSPKWWQKGLMVMLKKKKDVILVNKLWAILLMEAELNYVNKQIFGQRMLYFAESRGNVAKECFGSCAHHKATDVALNRRLICDISWQK